MSSGEGRKAVIVIVVLIDIDDVLNNLVETWCEVLNERYGTDVDYESVIDWDISKSFPGLTREQVFEPLHEPEIWDRMRPKEGTERYMKQLIDEGFDVYLCTTTDYRNVQYKFERFVQKYYPFIDWNRVIITGRKQMIKADFLIDDGVHNLEGGDYVKILIDAPHNRGFEAELNKMHRAHSFLDAYRIIHRYKSIRGD